MYSGKLVFAQVMDHLPMHTFRRAVSRYGGNRYVKSFPCHSQFLCMAFAQLTYRESLRDIEVCLRAQRQKLYHLGISQSECRATRWPMRTSNATGESPRRWRKPLILASPDRCTPVRSWVWTSITPCSPSTHRPSTCACPCFRGHRSSRRRRRSSCTRCSTCAARLRRSCMSPTSKMADVHALDRFVPATWCLLRDGSCLTSTSSACTPWRHSVRSSSSAQSPTRGTSVGTLGRSTRRPVFVVIKASCSRLRIPRPGIRSRSRA